MGNSFRELLIRHDTNAEELTCCRSFVSPRMRGQLVCHILAYAEMLRAWQLPEKRSELLKLVEADVKHLDIEPVVADEVLYQVRTGELYACTSTEELQLNLT